MTHPVHSINFPFSLSLSRCQNMTDQSKMDISCSDLIRESLSMSITKGKKSNEWVKRRNVMNPRLKSAKSKCRFEIHVPPI